MSRRKIDQAHCLFDGWLRAVGARRDLDADRLGARIPATLAALTPHQLATFTAERRARRP